MEQVDRALSHAIGEHALVQRMERLGDLSDVLLDDLASGRDGHGQLVDLVGVLRVGKARDLDTRARETLALQLRDRCRFELGIDLIDPIKVEIGGVGGKGLERVVAHVAHDHAVGTEDAGIARDDRLLDAELLGQRACVNRAGAAPDYEAIATRVDTLLDRYDADRIDHIRVDDVVDAIGCLLGRKVQRFRHLFLDHASGRLGIDPPSPAQEVIRVDIAEHHV